MSYDTAPRILFLCSDSPWPAYSGAALRTLGLLGELSKTYLLDLVVLTRTPLAADQRTALAEYTTSLTEVPLRDVTLPDRIQTASLIVGQRYPYHSAAMLLSLRDQPEIQRRIANYPGIVFTSTGHWGALVRQRHAPNWILNQCDADVEFWHVYATQARHPLARLAARLNYRLARRHYPPIYANVGRVISVCEEDRQHTLTLTPEAHVEVIENGIDCAHYVPRREVHSRPPCLLFTGTSAPRNMTALHGFVRHVLPLIRAEIPSVELLVGGNFAVAAQREFAGVTNMRFTGRVEDMRPVFDQSDVFVAPFAETHGSKLKIAEAMAMAMPIVSTPAGIRGFALRDSESALVAKDPEQFSRHVVALLTDPGKCERLGAAARQVAVSTIDWAVLGKELRRIVAEVVSSWERTRDHV